MTYYLLAAEADKIQDLIFRSARLREVVGSSQLLATFCDESKQLLESTQDRFIVNDGGSFRIVFEDDDAEAARTRALNFGCDLAELYHRCTGGALTVAEPVEYLNEEDFTQANHEAQSNLRHAKHRGPGSIQSSLQPWLATPAHLPYVAFCASCGVELACTHDNRHDDERSDYICQSCQHKFAEARRSEEDNTSMGDFLDDFRTAIQKCLQGDPQLAKTRLGSAPKGDWTDAFARFDPRRYVAYLKADGNGMGAVFSRCQKQQLKELSEALTPALRDSLAAPTPYLLRRLAELNIPSHYTQILPILPLILGGDDLFALLPASWALDFAAQFCCNYEQQLQTKLQKIGLDNTLPTLSAAVVICKANYPYTLAHERCEALMKEAKRFARYLKMNLDQAVSVLHFDVITGNDVGDFEPAGNNGFRSTLRPYLVGRNATDSLKYGLPLDTLLEQRLELQNLPNKRLAELKQLYDTPPDSDNQIEQWNEDLQSFLKRIQVSSNLHDEVELALKDLGDSAREREGYWRRVQRPHEPGNFEGHGLPDLLLAWDFALRLNEPHFLYED